MESAGSRRAVLADSRLVVVQLLWIRRRRYLPSLSPTDGHSLATRVGITVR